MALSYPLSRNKCLLLALPLSAGYLNALPRCWPRSFVIVVELFGQSRDPCHETPVYSRVSSNTNKFSLTCSYFCSEQTLLQIGLSSESLEICD
jgi:hypothetical protein